MTWKERLLSPPGVTVVLFALIFLSLSTSGPKSQLTAFVFGVVEIELGIVLVANSLLIGKLIAGLLVNFRIWGVDSGPLAISWAGGMPSLELRWKWYPFPGTVAMSPKSREGLERKTVIILGGGLFVLSITTLLAFILPWMGIVALNNAYAAARFGGLTLLAYSFIRGEGHVIYDILKNRPAGDRLILAHLLDIDILGSLRPREWALEPIEEALKITVPDPLAINGALIGHLRARDAGDFQEAVRCFDIAADGLLAMQPKIAAWMLDHSSLMALGLADAISFLAANQIKPAAECRAWLHRLDDAVTDRTVVLRAEAGVLLAEGSPTLARGVAREAQSRIRGSVQINAGWKTAVDEWLTEIIQLSEQPARAPLAKPAQPAPAQEEAHYRVAPSYARVSWQRPAFGILFRSSLVPLLLLIAFGGWRLVNLHWAFVALLTIVVFWLVTTSRALGRLICGRLAGFTPRQFIAGPLLLSFTPRWRVQLNRDPIRSFGYDIVIPPTTDDLTEKILIRLIGGTIGLIVTATLLIIIDLLDSGLRVESSGPSLPLMVNLVLSAFIFILLVGIILFALADSVALRVLFGGGPRARAWAATEALNELVEAGERPRAWRRDWLEQATANVLPFTKQSLAHRFAYFHALDLGDIERAELELYRAFRSIEATRKKTLKTTMLPLVQVEAAFFEAHYRGNVERAGEWLVKSNTGIVPKRTWLRAQAALLHASGDTALAMKEAREALAAPRHLPTAGIALLEDEWLAEMAEVKQVVPRDDPPPAALRPIKFVPGWRS